MAEATSVPEERRRRRRGGDGHALRGRTSSAPAPNPFAEAVGTGAWCLHVYSFDDSLRAQRELAIMAKRDVVGRIHAEDSGDRHLFRVFAGNFPTREAALAAEPELFDRLRTDWAMPVRSTRFQ